MVLQPMYMDVLPIREGSSAPLAATSITSTCQPRLTAR